MRPRWLVVPALVVIGLGATVLGATGAALRTAAGRRLVVRAALDAANRGLDGRVTVGVVGGSLTGGLDAREVQVWDPDGALLARFERLQLRYRLQDLLGAQAVLGQVILTAPSVSLFTGPDGTFNYERVLRLNRPGGGGPRPLIAFHDVEITDGRVTIQTRQGGLAGKGPERQRTIEGLSARLPYARISSPFPGEEPLHFEVARLVVSISDPAIELAGARGTLEIRGDSLGLDFDELRLPQSTGAVRGTIRWPKGALWYDLDVRGQAIVLEDLWWLNRDFPSGLTGAGRVVVRSRAEDVVEVRSADLRLTGAGGRGGQLRGRLGLILGPDDRWALARTDVRLDDFDLEYWRPMLDTLPIAGRLSGPFTGDGPMDSLTVAFDWTFRDSLVDGWPVSALQADGRVALGVPGGFEFHDLIVRRGSFDLGTVRRLIPLTLVGRVDGAGALNGSWLEPEFSGMLRHQDEPLPPSVVRGVLRVDARRDTIGVWADWAVDSLSLDGLRSSFPELAIGGTFGGNLRLGGYLDSARLTVDLAGPAGAVRGTGDLVLLAPPWGARRLEATLRHVSLRVLDPSWPPTSLNGRVEGTGWLDSAAAPRAQIQVRLESSDVSGTVVDSAWAIVAVEDGVLRADTAALWGPAIVATARGDLGLAASREGAFTAVLRSDSAAALEPLVRWLRAPGEDALPDSVTSGGVELGIQVTGSRELPAITWRGRVSDIRWGSVYVRQAMASGELSPGGERAITLDADADSVVWRGRSFSALETTLRGPADSVSWFGRARLGSDGSWLAGGRWLREAQQNVIVLDSMGLLLESDAWFVSRAARIGISDSAIEFTDVRFTSARGRSAVSLTGRLPRAGSGGLRVGVEGLPLEDVWALAQLEGGASGELSGTLELSGTAADPAFSGTVALTNGVFGEFRAPYVSGTLEYRDQRLAGEFGLWRAGQQILKVDAQLPLDLALRSVGQRRLPGRLAVRAVADGVDLVFIEAMIPVVRGTGGRLFADVGIAGTWARPELTGSVTVRDGAATVPALGVRHEQLDGHLLLSGDTIRVERLSVRSGEGRMAVSGYVRLEELTKPRLAIRLAGDRFPLIDVPNFVTATASGDFALDGPVFGATLTGRGTITRGVLYFTDLITKQVIRLEDPRYADLIDTSLIRRQGLGEEFQSRVLEGLRIDSLSLEMGGDVWMRSSEANIQLTGRLIVGKEADQYRLDGTLETPRGTYRLPLTTTILREFVVMRGQLQYFGTPDLNSVLDIDARHVVRRPNENVTVFVHIGGTLYEPSMRFSSDIRPPIAETEIISYLLFGTSSFEALAAGGQQGNAELLGVSKVLGALSGQIERSLISDLGLPLDFLQIRFGATGVYGTEIAVGKRITIVGVPTFLTLSPRICKERPLNPEELGISAELRMSRQWVLAASRDPVGACALGPEVGRYQLGLDLLWERTY